MNALQHAFIAEPITTSPWRGRPIERVMSQIKSNQIKSLFFLEQVKNLQQKYTSLDIQLVYISQKDNIYICPGMSEGNPKDYQGPPTPALS